MVNWHLVKYNMAATTINDPIENILRDLNDIKGCIVGGYNLNNVRYADDAVLIAGSESQLQELLNTVVDASLHRGLSINIKKTQCMVIN